MSIAYELNGKKIDYFPENFVHDTFGRKDLKVLTKYVSERGKIIPSRISAVSAKRQRELSKAIKRARFLALMPYVVG